MVRYLVARLAAGVGYLWLGVSTLLGFIGRGLAAFLSGIWRGISMVLGTLAGVARALLRLVGRGLSTLVGYLWLGISTAAGYVGRGVRAVARYVWTGVVAVGRDGWLIVSTAFRYLWRGLRAVARYVGLGASAVFFLVVGVVHYVGRGVARIARFLLEGIAAGFGLLWRGLSAALHLVFFWVLAGLRRIGLGLTTAVHYVSAGALAVARPIGRGIAAALGYLWLGVSTLGRYLLLGGSAVGRTGWRGASTAFGYLALGTSTAARGGAQVVAATFRPVAGAAVFGARHLWLGVATGALTIAWVSRGLWQGLAALGALTWRVPRFVARTVVLAYLAVPGTARMLVWMARQRKGVPAMSDFNLTRERLLSLIATVWVIGIVGFIGYNALLPPPPPPKVHVVHWTTGHLLQTGGPLKLLPQMADEFNKAGHRTEAGTLIEVDIQYANGAVTSRELISRLTGGGPIDKSLLDPVLVTPSASHWLVNVNYAAGRQVVDLTDLRNRSIARTYVGILTYRDMAECLGWPQKAIGYADIIALRDDPEGWARYPCAKAEWGQKPLVAFTDPAESDTGRAVLFALWGMGARKPMEQLTLADLQDPDTVGFVRGFAGVVDHYMATTSIVNTKVYQGPRYGHFFIMPEDNVIQLYKGTAKAFVNGKEITAPPITEKMVMIYPKEGSLLRDNCACRVQASWVTAEQAEAAEQWVSFLHEDAQQASFLVAGFRPGTDMPVGDPFGAKYGLDPKEPAKVLYSERVDPAVGAAIDKAWPEVKKPGIVTFVADTSGSMLGGPLQQEKDGLIGVIDGMAQTNRVGLIPFSDTVGTSIPVAPIAQNRYRLDDAIKGMKASGQTALYDAVKAAVEMTDGAEGPDDAIRGVVVLTDGKANRGNLHLDDVVKLMSSPNELAVSYDGMDGGQPPRDANGNTVDPKNVIGTGMALNTKHPIQIFFIGISSDADAKVGADIQIGRMMAEATGGEYQATTQGALAGVLETFGPYF